MIILRNIILFFCSLVNSHRIPSVYYYTVNENACTRGLPNYLQDTLIQAIETQPDCDVYLISNDDECLRTHNVSLKTGFPNSLRFINFDDIKSNKSKTFLTSAEMIFSADGLWMVISSFNITSSSY